MTETNLHSHASETALLGAALINPDAIRLIDLEPDAFHDNRHQNIWRAMQSLAERESAVDTVTLTDALDSAGKLREVGGSAYIVGLMTAPGNAMYIQDYAEAIRDKARRRKIMQAARELAKAAVSEGDIGEQVSGIYASLTGAVAPKFGAVHISEHVDCLEADVERRMKNPRQTYGISTGLASLNKIFGGLQSGEMYYFGGAPGLGKSILTFGIAVAAAKDGAPGAIYSLEMGRVQVTRRMVSALGRMPTDALKSGIITTEDLAKYRTGLSELRGLPIYLSDRVNWTLAGIRADLARLQARHGIKWFLVDYIGLLSGFDDLRRHERLEQYSKQLKNITRETELACLAVSSVNKDLEVSGTMAVQHDPDVIMVLGEHKADLTTGGLQMNNMRTLHFRKGRDVKLPKDGYLHLVMADDYPQFYDFEPDPGLPRVKSNGKGR